VKISVVTITFNSAATIADTLLSVGAQSHPEVEHIIVDGNSTDATADIVRRHGSRVAQFVSERDEGIYDAMNKGLARATGELVGFLNADDVYADENVLADVASAAADIGVDAVYGDLEYVRANDMSRVVRRWRSGAFSRGKLRFGWMPPHPSLYVRRELVKNLGGFDSGLRVAGDYDFAVRYFGSPAFKAKYLNRVLVRMRMGGASNGSLRALARKSSEDLMVIRRHGLPGFATLVCKNLRKVNQFWAR
jgi:glycosyltransferase